MGTTLGVAKKYPEHEISPLQSQEDAPAVCRSDTRGKPLSGAQVGGPRPPTRCRRSKVSEGKGQAPTVHLYVWRGHLAVQWEMDRTLQTSYSEKINIVVQKKKKKIKKEKENAPVVCRSLEFALVEVCRFLNGRVGFWVF